MKPENVTVEDNDMLIHKFDELISAVLNKQLTPKIPIEYTLWSTQQVADYLGIAYKYASETIVTHHTFPSAIRLPTKKGTRGHPRWNASEVISWTSTYKD